jgi:hypothetical protein
MCPPARRGDRAGQHCEIRLLHEWHRPCATSSLMINIKRLPLRTSCCCRRRRRCRRMPSILKRHPPGLPSCTYRRRPGPLGLPRKRKVNWPPFGPGQRGLGGQRAGRPGATSAALSDDRMNISWAVATLRGLVPAALQCGSALRHRTHNRERHQKRLRGTAVLLICTAAKHNVRHGAPPRPAPPAVHLAPTPPRPDASTP